MRWFVVVTLVTLLAVFPVVSENPKGEGDALEAINIAIAVERTLLTESLREHQRLILRRDETAARLLGLQEALDAAVADEKAAESGRLDVLIDQVLRVAGERANLFETESALLGRISERRKRIALFGQQIELLAGRDREEDVGALTGTWNLVLMPTDQRGTCKLRQDGAVVNGTYELAGGWTGSLQGTLVDRKVYLVRIDTKLGEMMELEGYLSRDGQRIRGTWLNYELAGAEGSTGQFVADRSAPQ